ncbi:MAG: hypothetical protein ACT4OZ_15605, partial [Gemmatimonadota bacterium]
ANSLLRIGTFEIVQADGPRAGLEMLDGTVGCVIAGSEMAAMPRDSFIQAVRNHPRGRSVPLLMMFSRSRRDEVVPAIAAGATGGLIKPFTPRQLGEQITAAVARATAPA